LTGFGAGSTVTSDALASLTLAGSNEDVTVTNASSATLDLTLNGAGTSTNNADATLGATYTTLNVKTTGTASDINISATGVQTLNVSGDKAVVLSGSTFTALKTVTISGSAGVTNDVSGIATVTSVNASATSGANTITINPTNASYTGGSGADSVTLSNTTISKEVSLGAGNDTLTLAAGTTTSTGALNGGDGSDTLSMAAVDAESASAAATFESKFASFEMLKVGAVAGAQTDTIDLSNMNDISYVISSGNDTATGSLVINKMAAGGTLEVTGAAAAATDVVDVNLTDATGTSDSFNLITKVASAALNFGTVDLTGIETLALTATDTVPTVAGVASIQTATVTLKDANLKTVTVTGNSHLTLNLDAATTALTSVNGSAMTGVLTTTTNGTVAQTVTGGSAADVLTAKGTNDVLNGGAGNDTLALTGTTANLVTLTGGAGADTFNIGVATTNVNSYATITDLAAGDKVKFSAGAATFTSSKVSLGDTAVFQDYANAAINATNTGDIVWFQSGGNTYIVENVSNGTSFVNGSDVIVRITGLFDLSNSSFSSTADTLVIV
jgi:S-layer protein